jgi:hypothetical protein
MTMMSSCRNTDTKTSPESVHLIEKADWLIGQWQSNSETEKIAEVWEKENDTVYLGKSYSLKNTDTISAERIRLEEHGNKLFYIPVVKNQNIGEVVKFTLTSADPDQLVFENPEHDFPQKISYALITKDSLFAQISGMYKGKQESERYPMHRIK